MKKTKIYAVLVRAGAIRKRVYIGSVFLDDDRCSARRYCDLRSAARRAFPHPEKNEHVHVVTEAGLECRKAPVVAFATFNASLNAK